MLKSVPGVLTIALSIGAFAPLTYAQNIFQGNGSSVFVMTNDNTKNRSSPTNKAPTGSSCSRHTLQLAAAGAAALPIHSSRKDLSPSAQNHNLLFAINSASGTISSFHLSAVCPSLSIRESSRRRLPGRRRGTQRHCLCPQRGRNGAIVAFTRRRPRSPSRRFPTPPPLSRPPTPAALLSLSARMARQLVVIEKAPNNIDTFPIHPDGTLGTVVINHSVTARRLCYRLHTNGQLIVSEDQPDGTDVSSISSYTINADGTITAISQSLPTLGDGNCWNAITPNGASSSTPTTPPPPRSQASLSAPTVPSLLSAEPFSAS